MPTWAGMAFTAFVTDVCSRRIVGWRTASRMPTELPLDALEMALWTRAREGRTDADGRLEGLIQHSDAGSQYVAFRYTERLTAAGAVASIGTVGDSYDNALAESVIGLYKNECIDSGLFHDGPFKSIADVEYATAGWVDRWNNRRLHGVLGMIPPAKPRKPTTLPSKRCSPNTGGKEPVTIQTDRSEENCIVSSQDLIPSTGSNRPSSTKQ